MKTLIPICIMIACAFTTPGALAVPEKDTPLAPSEVKFLKEAGQTSLNEVKIGTLGSQKSQNPELKELAATLVTDHDAALKKATALAESKGIYISTVIDEDTVKTYKDLERKSGSEFDTALVAHLDKGHIKSIKAFEEAQKDCKDADLKAWIDETLVVIKAHHERIKKLK